MGDESLWDDPEMWKAVASLAEVVLALGVAVITGLWALNRWFAQRRDQEEERRRLEQEQLEQRRREDASRRAEQAAAILANLGQASDDQARRWSASALTLYPEETLPVLVNALGHADAGTASAIATALISIGPSALAPLGRANRTASALCRDIDDGDQPGEPQSGGSGESAGPSVAGIMGAGQMLRYSRVVIAHLVLQLDRDDRATIDLEDVDLCGVSFRAAHLQDTRFRKARLDHTVFTRALLTGANLRGVSFDEAVLTQAVLNRADLTGVQGCVHMISASLAGATLDHARLDRSQLDDADMTGASLDHTQLVRARLSGATLDDIKAVAANMAGIVAVRVRMNRARCERSRLARARLSGSTLAESVFVNCEMSALDAAEATASEASFTGCNLGGTVFRKATLDGATFSRCNLGGVVLAGAKLRGTVFDQCELRSVDLRGADLSGAVFRGANVMDPAKLQVDSTTLWAEASFEAGSEGLPDLFRRAGSG